MTGRLTVRESSHVPLRTPQVEGGFLVGPEVGQRFVMVGDALEGGDARFVRTSVINRVEITTYGWRFWTEHSEYTLELDEAAA